MDYHKGKPKAGVNYDAGEALEKMRPLVEDTLAILGTRYKGRVATCSSQSVRARQCKEALNEELRAKPQLRRSVFRRFDNVLANFLALHAAVVVLERGPLVDQKSFWMSGCWREEEGF